MNASLKPQVFIISGKNPLSEGGGYASFTYGLAKLITGLEFDCQIFCVGKKDQIIESKIGQIHIIGFKILSLSFFENMEMAALLILAPKLAFTIKKNLKPNQTNIVWGVGPWTLAGAILKLLPGKKRIILLAYYATSFKHEFLATLSALKIRDYGLKYKLQAIFAYLTIIQFYTLLEKFLLKITDKIITHYNSTEKILINQYNIKPARFYRLPYSYEIVKKISSVVPEKAGIHINKPLILLICRQDPRKGINFLLHAFTILNQRGIKFSALIIGGGKMLTANRALAKKLNLTNVFLPGFVADTTQVLKKAEVYVFPSIEEGNSAFSILEAMKAGLPIVSTNIDGIPEDLENNKSALLVPAKDPLALTDAMQKLLENPQLAKKLGKAAKKNFQNKHNLKTVKKQLSLFIASYQA